MAKQRGFFAPLGDDRVEGLAKKSCPTHFSRHSTGVSARFIIGAVAALRAPFIHSGGFDDVCGEMVPGVYRCSGGGVGVRGGHSSAGAACRLVSPRSLRNDHSLGPLLAHRPRRVGPRHGQDSAGGIQQARGAVQSAAFRRPPLGVADQTSRTKIPGDHHQASRRLLPVSLEAHQLRRSKHALPPRCDRGDRRRVSSSRATSGPLLFDHGLAPSRLSAAAPWEKNRSAATANFDR